MGKAKAGGVGARLTGAWGEVIFTAEQIEDMREQMDDMLRVRAQAKSVGEAADYASQGPAAWVGERIRRALISNDCELSEAHLRSADKVASELSSELGLFYRSPIENALLDALHAALQLQQEAMPLSDGPALVWRFCYRLAQIRALIGDAQQEEMRRHGKRGGPEDKQGADARRFALQYLREHCFDGGESITPQHVIAESIWRELSEKAKRDCLKRITAYWPACVENVAPDGNVTDAPTDGSLGHIKRWIRKDWRELKRLGKSGLEARQAAVQKAAQDFWKQRREKCATPDARYR